AIGIFGSLSIEHGSGHEIDLGSVAQFVWEGGTGGTEGGFTEESGVGTAVKSDGDALAGTAGFAIDQHRDRGRSGQLYRGFIGAGVKGTLPVVPPAGFAVLVVPDSFAAVSLQRTAGLAFSENGSQAGHHSPLVPAAVTPQIDDPSARVLGNKLGN